MLIDRGGEEFIATLMTFDSRGSASFCDFRFVDAFGKRRSPDFIPALEWSGPIFPMWRIPGGAHVLIDARNTTGGDLETQVIFWGWQRLATRPRFESGLLEPYLPLWKRYSQPPPGYHDERFDLPLSLSLTASQELTVPIQLGNDWPFLWRGLVHTKGGVGDSKLLWMEPRGNLLSNTHQFVSCDAGNILARPWYPEIACAPQSVIQLRAKEYLGFAATLDLALTGVRRVRD
jgi:hypothetical protein